MPDPADKTALRRWGLALAGLGAVAQVLGWLEYVPPSFCLFGIGLCAIGVPLYQVSKGNPKSYAFVGFILAILPIVGPVIGLLMNPSRPPEPASEESAPSKGFGLGSLGVVMVIMGLLGMIALNRETPMLGAGLIPAGLMFCLAEFGGDRGWRYFPTAPAIAALPVGVLAIWVSLACGLIRPSLMFRKSAEGTTKGNLGGIRSALSIYYGDTNGEYPADLEVLAVGGRYLPAIPPAKTPYYHRDSRRTLYLTDAQFLKHALTDAGGWVYVASGPSSGTVMVNCTHTDSKGTLWTMY